jgi:hypothetical protein
VALRKPDRLLDGVRIVIALATFGGPMMWPASFTGQK